MSDSLWPHGLEPSRLLCPWNYPGKNTGVGSHSFLQGSCLPRDWTRRVSSIADFPSGSDSKESASNAGDPSSITGSGRFPGEGNGYPLQYSCLENSMERGAWWAPGPQDSKESDMTEWRTLSPLRCSQILYHWATREALIVALIIIKTGSNQDFLRRMDKLQYIHRKKKRYYSAMKRNELSRYEETWMNLKSSLINQGSQSGEKATHDMILNTRHSGKAKL